MRGKRTWTDRLNYDPNKDGRHGFAACFLSLKRIANYLTDRQKQAEMI